MAETNREIAQNEGELLAMLQDLTTEDEKKAKDLKEFLELLK